MRGVALVIVMWAIALMTVLLGSFAMIAHTENLESRHVFDTVTARYDAETGLERATSTRRSAGSPTAARTNSNSTVRA
jgi:general secretion pathway protein K